MICLSVGGLESMVGWLHVYCVGGLMVVVGG